MDFGPYFRDFRSDLKGFMSYSRDFTSGFKVFKPDFRGFWSDFTDYRDFKYLRAFRDFRDFRNFRDFYVGFQDICTPNFRGSWPLGSLSHLSGTLLTPAKSLAHSHNP